MRLFTLIDFHHFVLALFLGIAAALVIYLAFRYVGHRRGAGDDRKEPGAAQAEYPDGLKIGDNPMPPVLMLLFVGFIVWLFFYVVVFGIRGGPL